MAKTNKTQILIDKHEQFCHEYIIDLNATQAYQRTYPDCSYETAQVNGCKLLRNAKIQKRIAEIKAEIDKEFKINAVEILQECYRIATADVKQAFDENGNIKPISEIPVDLRKAISGFEVEEIWQGTGKNRQLEGYLKKVKFWSKDKNLEYLFKNKGLFEKDHEQEAKSLADMIAIAQGLK